MKAEYKITEDDYVKALKLYGKLTPKLIIIYAVAIIILVLLAIYGSQIIRGGAIGALVGGSIAVFGGRFVVAPLLARRHYRKYKAIQEPMAVEFNDDGLMFYSTDAESKLKWNKILKWRQNSDYILVYLMPRLYHVIPKPLSNIGFKIDKLVALLEQNVGKET